MNRPQAMQGLRPFLPILLMAACVQACVLPSEKSGKYAVFSGPLVPSDSRSIAIDRYIQSISPHSFSGVVVIEKDNQLMLVQGYGMAQREARLINRPEETIFPLGTLREPMLAALALQFEAAGGWQLLDTLQADSLIGPISPHTLMAHLGEDTTVHNAQLQADFYNRQYDLLALAYQQKSREKAEVGLRKYFWEPFGMEHTGYRLTEIDKELLAFSNGVSLPSSFSEAAYADTLQYPNPVYSNAADVYRWQKAMEQGRLLPAAQQQKWLFPYKQTATGWLAYGWQVVEDSLGHPNYSVSDTSGGYLIDYRWFPHEKLWVLVLGNRFDTSTYLLGNTLVQMVLNSNYSPVPAPNKPLVTIRWPEGPRSEVALALLALRGQPSDQQLQEFIATHYSLEFVAQYTPKEHLQYLRLLLDKLAGAEPIRLQNDSEGFQLVLKQADKLLQLQFKFGANNRIGQLGLQSDI